MAARLTLVNRKTRQPRILIVEDDAELRRLWRAALTVSGFEVVPVGDGIAALYHLEAEVPDLVVLDLGLPRVSGRDVVQELSANPRTRRIPILVVTGDPGNLVESANLCILRKPVDPTALSDAVGRCLRRMDPSWGNRR
jgi:DNA-binding response OmpR family regulator